MMLANLFNSGQTPWAQAQQKDWQNPGANMAQLPAQEIMKLLGMSDQSDGPPAAQPQSAPLKRFPLPPPETEPTAQELPLLHQRLAATPKGSALGGVLQQYGAGSSFQPSPGSEVKVSDAPMPQAATATAPIPPAPSALGGPSPGTNPSTARRPNFSIEPGGSEFVGALMEGAGGLLGPIGKLVGGSGARQRHALSQNKTYDWLLRQGTSPQDAELIVGNPDVMKAVLTQKFGAGGTTDELKEYKFTVNQLMQRGVKDIPTFDVWKAHLRKAGATNVTVDQRHESEFGKKLAAQEAERYGKLVTAGTGARDQLANLDIVGQAIDVYNQGSTLGTGALAPYESTLRSYGAALGIGNASTVGAAELVDSITNRMALLMRNPDSGMGMPGAMSDADRNFLKASQPGIDKSPAGNRRMVEILKRFEQRKVQLGEMAADWVGKNGTMKGFEQHINQWANANPLFKDLADVPTQRRTGGGDGASSFASPQASAALPSVRSDDDYHALPAGTQYRAPDGSLRRKN